MTIVSLERRLDRLGDSNGSDISAQLDASIRAQEERERLWVAAGGQGSPPLPPLSPPPEGRFARDKWRSIANGRARVLHLQGDDAGSPFASLREAYEMPDADLLAVINAHAWQAEAVRS